MNKRLISWTVLAFLASCNVKVLQPTSLGVEVNILNQEECLDINSFRVESVDRNKRNVLVVDSTLAIFIAPSNSRLEEMKDELDIDKYKLLKESLDFEIRKSKRVLDSLGVDYIENTSKYIKFSPYSGTDILIDTEMESVFVWKLFLAVPGKWPKSVNPLEISADSVLDYFELR
jgi:hypothetical protein